MSAPNFFYENRCIVVSDEDFEEYNRPTIGNYRSESLTSYPSNYIIDEDGKEFFFHNVIITSGYYKHYCLDYIVNDRDIEYYFGSPEHYFTQKEFFKDVKESFGLSKHCLRKVCGNMGEMDIDSYLEVAYVKLLDYLRKKEEKEVNKYLDNLRDYYGYEEIVCIGVASNGEGFYKKIA